MKITKVNGRYFAFYNGQGYWGDTFKQAVEGVL